MSDLTRMATRAAALALLAAATPALAKTETADLDVTATVAANCTITTTPIAFGKVDIIAFAHTDAEGSVRVLCTKDTLWQASADEGQGSGATHQQRKLTGAKPLADTMFYNLYLNAERTAIWGNGFVQNGPVIERTGTGTTQVIPIYGRVPRGQPAVNPDSYSDNVVVTLRY